jgi:hypothetical protein
MAIQRLWVWERWTCPKVQQARALCFIVIDRKDEEMVLVTKGVRPHMTGMITATRIMGTNSRVVEAM